MGLPVEPTDVGSHHGATTPCSCLAAHRRLRDHLRRVDGRSRSQTVPVHPHNGLRAVALAANRPRPGGALARRHRAELPEDRRQARHSCGHRRGARHGSARQRRTGNPVARRCLFRSGCSHSRRLPSPSCGELSADAPAVDYSRPRAERSRSALMRPGAPSSAGKLSRSLIRSPRRVGSSAACRGV